MTRSEQAKAPPIQGRDTAVVRELHRCQHLGTDEPYIHAGVAVDDVSHPLVVLGGQLTALRASGAGDVNGDGYADVLAWPDYQSFTVHLGSASGLEAEPATTIASPDWEVAASDLDLNGDGYDDVVVASSSALRAYLGGPEGVSATVASEANIPDDGLAFQSVAAAGDLDGDGYDDLLTGAYCVGCAAYVYRGSETGISAVPSLTLPSTDELLGLGHTVAAAGDVNGDGYDDAVITAYTPDWVGVALVYLGSATGPAAVPSATRAVGGSSAVAAGVGDLDADGYDDLVVGDWAKWQQHVYMGGVDGLGTVATPTLLAARNDRLGTSVAGGGDFDGDGHDDVLVGAWGADSLVGAVLVFAGTGAGLGTSPSLVLAGHDEANMLGYAVAALRDVDGDGFDDAAAGSAYADEAHVYLGSADGLVASTRILLAGDGQGAGFGEQVVAAGDVDGDGLGDVAVGGGALDASTWRAYVFLGHAALPMAGPPTLLAGVVEQPYDDAWVSQSTVAGAGDTDGDGFDDIAVGTPYGGTGSVYLFPGGPGGPSTTASATLTHAVNGYFGTSVAGAGDVNGDGYDDIVVGATAEYWNEPGGGVTTCFGSAEGVFRCDTSSIVDTHFRYTVAGAGDLDDDGYADVVVGASAYRAPEDDTADEAWEVSVLAGSANGVTEPVTRLTGVGVNASGNGATADYQFGLSISTAGDVDADGHADVILGAPEDNWGGGAALLYLGN